MVLFQTFEELARSFDVELVNDLRPMLVSFEDPQLLVLYEPVHSFFLGFFAGFDLEILSVVFSIVHELAFTLNG